MVFRHSPTGAAAETARTAHVKKWDFLLIAAIDDTQNLPPGPDSPFARFAQSIHNAKIGLPLMQVLAVLGGTPDWAGEVVLTRHAHLVLRALAGTALSPLSAEAGRDRGPGFDF